MTERLVWNPTKPVYCVGVKTLGEISKLSAYGTSIYGIALMHNKAASIITNLIPDSLNPITYLNKVGFTPIDYLNTHYFTVMPDSVKLKSSGLIALVYTAYYASAYSKETHKNILKIANAVEELVEYNLSFGTCHEYSGAIGYIFSHENI